MDLDWLESLKSLFVPGGFNIVKRKARARDHGAAHTSRHFVCQTNICFVFFIKNIQSRK